MNNPFFTSCCLIFLSGCISLTPQQAHLGAQVEGWIAEHKYQRAIGAIQALPPDHPEYQNLQELLGEIEQQQNNYVNALLQEAARYERAQDWVAAQNSLAAGLRNLPNQSRLTEQYNHYEVQRRQRLMMDNAAITLARAEYIIQVRPHQESKLYNSDSTLRAKAQFNAFLQEAREIAVELMRIAKRYQAEEKYTQARKALELARQTAPTDEQLALLNDLDALRLSQSEEINATQQRQNQRLSDLEALFNIQLAGQELLAATATLNRLKELAPEDTLIYQEELIAAKATRAETLIISGDRLYNSGYVARGMELWQEALTLAPNNQNLQQRIARGANFLSNLERWKAASEPVE